MEHRTPVKLFRKIVWFRCLVEFCTNKFLSPRRESSRARAIITYISHADSVRLRNRRTLDVHLLGGKNRSSTATKNFLIEKTG